MSDVIVKMEHVRAAGLCSRGARQWCQRHNLDYGRFLREGYPVETVEAIDDALGKKVAQRARTAAGEA